MISDKTFTFVISLLAIITIWWIVSRTKPHVYVFLYGSNKNPYISNVVKGVTKVCNQENTPLSVYVFEDVSKPTCYHDAITSCPGSIIVCRLYGKDTLDTLRRVGKKAVVICSEKYSNLLLDYTDVVIKSIHTSLPEYEHDSIVVTPSADFPPIDTQGAVVSTDDNAPLANIIDQVLSFAKTYNLQCLYTFGETDVFGDRNLQKALRSTFRKVRVHEVPGEIEGKESAMLCINLIKQAFTIN